MARCRFLITDVFEASLLGRPLFIGLFCQIQDSRVTSVSLVLSHQNKNSAQDENSSEWPEPQKAVNRDAVGRVLRKK